jgi:hypothetical protein
MADCAALLADEVFPEQPVRQWVLSVPYPLRFLFASRPAIMGQVLGIVYRCIARHLIKKAAFSRKSAQAGAVGLTARLPGKSRRQVSIPRLERQNSGRHRVEARIDGHSTALW